MRFRSYTLLLISLCAAAMLRSQSTVPALTQALPNQSLAPGGLGVTVDLRSYFSVPGVTGQVVQFDTVMGKFNVELLASAAPQHAANFLNYVNAGSYLSSFVHRSASFGGGNISIIQGGGYIWQGTTYDTIAKFNPVPLEYNLPNARGTLAAARTSDINSATSEWFFNIQDNSTNLNQSNGGGYTVFGRVLGNGMAAVDAIAALPRLNAGGAFTELPVRNYTAGNAVVTANLAIVDSISPITMYPGAGTSLLGFSGQNTAGAVVRADLVGSSLVLTPLTAGTATVTIRAADVSGSSAEDSFVVTVFPAPAFGTQPAPQTVAANAAAAFSVGATASTAVTYQWLQNGLTLAGETGTTLNIASVQPASAGAYTAVATGGGVAVASRPGVLGLSTTEKVIGTGEEVGVNITHPNTKVYDQVELKGPAAAVTADASQTTRISFVDLNDDIVQVEFVGKGTVSLVLTDSSAPAAPVNYNQPNARYAKGHVGIVVTGADESSNLSVFTVGRMTAFDPTGAYNFLLAPSDTNVPANNGSSLFVGHSNTNYDGVADIAFVAIVSSNGKFGGLRTANARYLATSGITGVYAPGVEFNGPVYVSDIAAFSGATPYLTIGSALGQVGITGGDLLQDNGRAIQVAGLTQVHFLGGTSSHGTAISAKTNRGVLVTSDGVDVTATTVVNP